MLARNYICYIIVVANSIPSTLEQETISIEEAGKVPRVWNGTRTIPHSRPYVVQILREGLSDICGVILNAYTILTSANLGTGKVLKIVAGKHRARTYEPTQQTREICTTSAHPSFNGVDDNYNYGLIHLSDPFVLNEYVNAIRMAPPGFKPEGDCTIVGWGSTDPDINRLESLNEAVVQFADPATCGFNHPTNICILPIGGPLREPVICQRDSKIYAYGIHTQVQMTAGSTIPRRGYITLVPELPRDWLMEEVQKVEELCGKSYY